ncbi:MAG TPA: hypothetical protein VK617_16115, partial [Gemmatimonadaceae bacterium]|nr:hypothetical protein [Gemmatimonadaceae bacterium]
MHGEGFTARIARPSPRAASRRARESKGTLPRAYLAARRGALEVAHHGVRRARVASHRLDDTQEPSPRPRSPAASPARPASVGLTRGDRWVLVGLMLGGSFLVAVLTSTLTVQGIERTRPTSVASSGAKSVASSNAAQADSVAAVGATPIPASRDTMPMVPSAREVDSTRVASASHIDSAPRHEVVHAAAPAPRRVNPHTERRALTVAEHVRAAPQLRRVGSKPSLEPSTVAPQAVTASATPPAAAPAITAPASGAPAAAPAANNALVLEELRAIHAEINARKRHVDSLTASLDSLKRGTTPD